MNRFEYGQTQQKSFYNTVIEKKDFTSFDFSGSKFLDCVFKDCIFTKAIMERVEITNVTFETCLMSHVLLSRSVITLSSFIEVNLSDSSLAYLRAKNLSFQKSYLENTLIDCCTFYKVQIQESSLRKTIISDSKFLDKSFIKDSDTSNVAFDNISIDDISTFIQ